MRPFIDRLSYANVMSTLAVFLALTGSAVAAGVPEMITGEQIQDGTITSRDVKDRTLHAYDLRPAARRLLSTHSSAAPIENYQDLDPIARQTLPYKGFYVAFTQFRARNTGASDASLNCGYRVGTNTFGAAGVFAQAGQTSHGFSVTVVAAPKPGMRVRFACQSSGSTTWNLSRIRLTSFRLGY